MRNTYLSFLILTGLFLTISAGHINAQVKIGDNGTVIAPASLLELESTNRGFLLPRMANTTAIDALNPPTGMLIYITTEPSGVYVRKANGWEYLSGFLGGNGVFNSLTVSGNATAGSFTGPLNGNATSATTSVNATNSANSLIADDLTTPNVAFPVFVTRSPGNQPLYTGTTNLSYVPSTGILTARGFVGPLTGNVTGTATASVDAQNTVNIRVTDDLVSAAPLYPTMVTGNAGPLPARVSSTRLSFIPQTGELTAPIFRGNLNGTANIANNLVGMIRLSNVAPTSAVTIPVTNELDVDYPVAGAAATGTVMVSPSLDLPAGLGIMSARINVAGVVRVRYRNFTNAPLNAGNINLTVIQ